MKTNQSNSVLDNLLITNELLSTCKNVQELLSLFLQEVHNLVAEEAAILENAPRSKVEAKKMSFLRDALRGLYLDEYPRKLIGEIAINYSASYTKLWEDFFRMELSPALFEVIQSRYLDEKVRERMAWLKGPQHVVRGEELSADAGESPKLEAFLVDVFGYVDTRFVQIPLFKDTDLETLLSNDGIVLEKKNVFALASFFSEGDSNYKDKEYDPDKYYGGYPVSEDTIKAHLRNEGVPKDQTEKLIAIVKVSRRFYKEVVDGEERYCLKTQYLKNFQAYSVAILYKAGKPLHVEEINRQVAELARRYPLLVSAQKLGACQLRRKPVIEGSGAHGERRLKFWAKTPNKTSPASVREHIRAFVEKEYAKTGRPVPIEIIQDDAKRSGFTTKYRSLRTYAGIMCTSVKGKGYVPKGTPVEGADTRNWYGEVPRLQRSLAEILLSGGKAGMTYKQLMDKMSENGEPVNRDTLLRAIRNRGDVFLVDTSGFAHTVCLASHLSSSRAIRLAIPDKETKFSAKYPQVVEKIVDYLWEQPDHSASQNLLAGLFEDEFPAVKSGRHIIRKILNDTDLFVKTRIGAGTAREVSLAPLFVEKLRLERKESRPVVQAESPRPTAETYDYAALKESIVKHNAKFFEGVIDVVDLPHYVDEMVGIMRNGKKEMAPNSVFADENILTKMHKYYCLKTDPEDRNDLRKSLLKTAECYLQNYAFLAHGKEYDVDENLGFVMGELREWGDIPKWLSNPSTTYELYGNQINNNAYKIVKPQRNKQVGHANNALELADSIAIQGIEGCIHVFLHLAYRLVKGGKSAI